MTAFDRAIEFVQPIKESGKGKVLVHCFMGINRSAVTAMAILIKLEGMSLFDAHAHMVAKRERVNPFAGNQEKIAAWEQKVNGSCTKEDWLKR